MKHKHRVIENVTYYFKTVLPSHPAMQRHMMIQVICTVFMALATVLIPTVIVNVLASSLGIETMIVQVSGISLGLAVLTYVLNRVTNLGFLEGVSGRILTFGEKVYGKYITMDYTDMTQADLNYSYTKALDNGINSNWEGAEAMYTQVLRLLKNGIGFLVYGVIISFYSPFIFLVVLLSGMLSFYGLNRVRRYKEENRKARSALQTKRRYLKNQSIDMRNAEDVRLYPIADWLNAKNQALKQESFDYAKREHAIQFVADICDMAALVLREGFAYIYLVISVYQGMSLVRFTLFFSLMSGFTTWMKEIVDGIFKLQVASQGMDDLREFLDYPETHFWGSGEAVDGELTIVFDHISFCYPGQEKRVIDDFNVELKAGEKLALVGINGAGKSTLVKLLCGLIHPTEGVIRINGFPQSYFSESAYMGMISPVFQESEIWALNVEQNIAMSRLSMDQNRLEDVLEKSGMMQKVAGLKEGLKTQLTRNIYLDGENFSGGEQQKLMLARALYKQGRILVLDEPTAALDALAEQAMYESYQQLVGTHTSLFISHRLSSTRFCDRILFLANGRVLESGSHEELMRYGGEYASMFHVQSQYYKEDQYEAV